MNDMNDMKDDVHMTTESTNNTLINALVPLLKPEIVKVVKEEIEYYMKHDFNINDYTDDLDLYEVKRDLVDEVIDSIKNRL